MIISNIIEGVFLERPNRFTVVFKSGDIEEKAHLRDPGRLKELLLHDARLLLRPAKNLENRKTKFDVIAVESEGIWVLINSGFHSDLAEELIESGIVTELSNYNVEKREYTYGNSRIDFLLTNELVEGIGGTLTGDKLKVKDKLKVNKNLQRKLLLEVKGCTLVENGHGRFPDAPTIRGKRHLEELIKAKNEEMNSAVLFVIPRGDANTFSPNWKMDPEFSSTLEEADKQNVMVLAYSFNVNYQKNELTIKPFKKVEVKIKP